MQTATEQDHETNRHAATQRDGTCRAPITADNTPAQYIDVGQIHLGDWTRPPSTGRPSHRYTGNDVTRRLRRACALADYSRPVRGSWYRKGSSAIIV